MLLALAWGSECRGAMKIYVGHLQSNQDEADSKVNLHALDATVAL